jgi:uncharacterized protein (TIGR03545 family)
MRWSYLIPRAVLLLSFWGFFAFAFDPLLRHATIIAGQEVAGARVELVGLSTSFFPPTLKMSRASIANRFAPDENLAEFEELSLELEGDPLLRKAFIVREGSVTGLRWSTARAESGKLESSIFDGLGRALKIEGLSGLGDDWIDRLGEQAKLQLDPQQLETVRVAGELRQEWSERFESYEQRVQALEARAKQIERSVRTTEGDTLGKLDAYRQAAVDVKQLLADAQQIRQELEQLPNVAQGDFQRLDAAYELDRREIENKLQVASLDPNAICEALLGRELSARLEEHLAWLRVIREHVAWGLEPPEPMRMRGEGIVFAARHELPGFLVRSLQVSGFAELDGQNIPFEGTLSGLTTDPAVYGQPALVHVSAQAPQQIELDAMLDHTSDTRVHQFSVSYTSAEPRTTTIGDPQGVALSVAADTLKVTTFLEFVGENLSGEITFHQEPVTVTVAGSDHGHLHLQQILEDALQQVDTLDAAITLTGTQAEPQLSLETNVGSSVTDGLNEALGEAVARQRENLLTHLDHTLQQETAELRQLMGDRYRDIVAELDLNENQSQLLIQRFAGRPIDVQQLFRR